MNTKESHISCPVCPSSDAFTIYEDGHGHCFSCLTTLTKGDVDRMFDNPIQEPQPTKDISMSHVDAVGKGRDGHQPIDDRKLSFATVKKFNVTVEQGVAQYYPYYDSDRNHVANKVRRAGKQFTWEGTSQSATLFGQHVFGKDSAKAITITEGELDAMACYQLLGSRYPAVSVHNAQKAKKNCQQNYKYLDSFKEIVICFDNDEAGKKASEEVSRLFPNKSKVMIHSNGMKDACDYLMADRDEEFRNAWFGAERYTPSGIVSGKSLYSRLKNKKKPDCLALPWTALQDLTYGLRLGEMWTITAGSGMGKTQVLRELAYHIQNSCNDKIGMMFFEETLDDSGRGIISLGANKPLHLPTTEVTEEEFDEAFKITLGSDKYHFFDAMGVNELDKVEEAIRYLAQAEECRYIFLDHISILVSDQSQGDERKALDAIAHSLRHLCQELNIWLGMVSHSKRPTGKSHEEGGQTSLSELRGTAGIGQLSNMVLGLERDGQNPDPTVRNTTLIRVLKNRFSGLTGPSTSLYYDRNTSRLTEVFPDEVDEDVEDFEEL